jgi:hypothetical protein
MLVRISLCGIKQVKIIFLYKMTFNIIPCRESETMELKNLLHVYILMPWIGHKLGTAAVSIYRVMQ